MTLIVVLTSTLGQNDTSMLKRSRNDSKSVQNDTSEVLIFLLYFKSHFEITPKGSQNDTIKRAKMTIHRCQPKRSHNDSFEGVVLGSRNRLH